GPANQGASGVLVVGDRRGTRRRGVADSAGPAPAASSEAGASSLYADALRAPLTTERPAPLTRSRAAGLSLVLVDSGRFCRGCGGLREAVVVFMSLLPFARVRARGDEGTPARQPSPKIGRAHVR